MERIGWLNREAEAAGLALLHFTSFRRRSGVLLYALVAFCVFLVLPKPDLHIGRAVPFFTFGSSDVVPHPSTVSGSDVDILKYVSPLIGTANGGHVFPGATLPYGKPPPSPPPPTPGSPIPIPELT